MHEAQVEAISDSKDHNIVTLRSPDMVYLDYIADSFAISAGQEFDPPTVVQSGPTAWTIDINCGRSKTAPIADGFLGLCGGEEFVCNAYATDSTPDALNFLFGVKVGFLAAGKLVALNFYLGQGSNLIHNNWWIGGVGVANRGAQPIIVPITMYETSVDAIVTHQIYQIAYSSVNDIEFQRWI